MKTKIVLLAALLLVLAGTALASFEPGSYLTFGTYPQTESGKDETPIEWLVLDRQGNKALLLSRYGLDAKSYHKDWEDVTWEDCTLRAWLNGEFMSRAFSVDEQAAILETDVDNSTSQGYGKWNTSGGNDTKDRVFLLSYAEAHRYLGVERGNCENMKSRVGLTEYARKNRAHASDFYQTEEGMKAAFWWLRSPGSNPNDAARVHVDGTLYCTHVHDFSICVRPALWVNLETEGF